MLTGMSAEQERLLYAVVLGARDPRGGRCPCRSGRRYGNCHRDWVKQLRLARRQPEWQQAAGAYLKVRETLP